MNKPVWKRLSLVLAAVMVFSCMVMPLSQVSANADSETLKQELEAAKQQVKDTKNEYEAAKAKYEDVKKAEAEAQRVLGNATGEYEEAAAGPEQAALGLKSAAADAVESKRSAYDKVAKELEAAETEKTETKKAYEEACAKYDPAVLQKALTDAQKKVSSCESALNKANANQLDAQDTYDNIGRSFINEKSGSSLSVEKLTDICKSNSSLKSYVGSDKYEKALSSTLTVDNLKKSAEYVDECNQLRAKHGLPALKVNYRLMCMSAVSTAISSQVYDHALIKQWYSSLYSSMNGVLPRYPSENISWGGADPFDGWYTDEKSTFEKSVASGNYPGLDSMSAYQIQSKYPNIYNSIGHYLNIIDDSMTISGFACSDTRRTKEQLFANGSYGESVTPSAFKSALDTYSKTAKKALDSAKTAAEKASEALDQAKDELKAAETAFDEGDSIISSAKTAAENAEKAYINAESKKEQAGAELDAAVTAQKKADAIDLFDPDTYEDYAEIKNAFKAVEQAKEKYKAAQKKADDLAEQVSEWRDLVEVYKSDYESAMTALEDAEKAYDSVRVDIKNAVVTGLKDTTYNGKKAVPDISVTVGNERLDEDDYIVSFRNNKNVGTAVVIIKGTGEYKGAVTKTFRIIPKGTKVKKAVSKKKALKIKWRKQRVQTNGYQIQVSTKKTFKSGTKTVNIKRNKVSSKKVRGLKSNKKYYVRIRTFKKVNGKKYYSKWSKVKIVKTR